MKRYTREEMLRESGARPEELTEIEAKGLLVPKRPGWFDSSRGDYYTEQQLGVLLWIMQTRRLLEGRRLQEPVARQS